MSPLEPELMDDPALPPELAARALTDLDRIHRRFGLGALWRPLLPLLPEPATAVRLLDVGTGSGFAGEAIRERAAGRADGLTVVGLDRKLSHLLIGRRRHPDQLRVVGDAQHLPLRDGGVELAMSTLFQHHFDERAGGRVLDEMKRVSSLAVVVADLRQSALGRLLGGALLRLSRLGPVAATDGAISLRQAWPLERVRAAAGDGVVELRRRWPFRWSLVLQPQAAARGASGSSPYTSGR